MAVTANDVKALRADTGAGMMDCKKALGESGGDIEAAKKILREKGLAAAGKRSGRSANEGLVEARVAPDGSLGVLVEVSCETDFVAKGERFHALAGAVADVAFAAKGEIGAAEDAAISALIDDAQVDLQEKIEFKRATGFAAGDGGVVDAYLHKTGGWAKMGVLVEMAGEGLDAESLAGLAHDLALHIQFARPSYLLRDEVDDKLIDAEREVAEAKARNEGKPDKIIERIVEGAVTKLFKDTVLLEQPYVREDKKSVEQWLKGQSDGKGSVVRFARFEIGEDAGAEVA